MGWWEGRVGRGGGVKENLVPLYIDKMHELVVFSQVGLTIKGSAMQVKCKLAVDLFDRRTQHGNITCRKWNVA